MSRFSLRAWIVVATAGLIGLSGCQAMFTYSPLGFLQTDPSNMTTEQLAEFGADVLASGDTDAITSAYNAIGDQLASGDLSAAQETELSELAGDLAVELSGIGDVLSDVIDGSLDVSDASGMDAALAAIDDALLQDASGLFVTAADGGADLNTNQLVLGALGIIAGYPDYNNGACEVTPAANEQQFYDALFDTFDLSCPLT